MCKLTVVLLTYNVVRYFDSCIKSVLSQMTDYNYKIIIADDCSDDGTLEIIEKYKKEYPDKIEVYYSEINRGLLNNTNKVLKYIDTDYFTILDGDDYWIDNYKIQKQIDFLEKNKQFSMHAGNTIYLKKDKFESKIIEKRKTNAKYSFENQLNDTIPFCHTSSIMFRNVIFKFGVPDVFFEVENTFEDCAIRGEDFRRIIHLEAGMLYVSEDVFSVYRIHDKGVWQGASDVKRMIERAIINNFHAKYFGNKYGTYFYEKAKLNYTYLIVKLFFKYKLYDRCCIKENDLLFLNDLLIDVSNNDEIYNISLMKCIFMKIKYMIKEKSYKRYCK